MKISYTILALVISTVAIPTSVNAAIIKFEKTFNISNLTSDSEGKLNVVTSEEFLANLSTFDSNLGELVSFTIDWNIDFSIEGTATASGGEIQGGVDGDYFINSNSYSGNGRGFFVKTEDAGTISSMFNLSRSSNFNVAGPRFYNPENLSDVTNGTNFDVKWTAVFNMFSVGVSEFSADASGIVSVTYDFIPTVTDVPEPSTFLVLALGLSGVCLRKFTLSR